MKGFIMSHKKGLAIAGIILLIFVILCIFVWGFLFPDGSKSEYGNRLDGIDKVRISDDKLKKLETELEGHDFVKSADAYITGRIINVMIDVNDGTDVATAKALTEVVKSNFSEDELAFYDALTKPEAIKDFYQHGELKELTKELTDLLRKNRTIDWQKKESARAGMRRLVKRLLRKYKYPPEGAEEAMQTVMAQCELWADTKVYA